MISDGAYDAMSDRAEKAEALSKIWEDRFDKAKARVKELEAGLEALKARLATPESVLLRNSFGAIAELTGHNMQLRARMKALKALLERIRPLLIDVDSELSAIGHGRPPSSDKELLEMSGRARDLHAAAVSASAVGGDAPTEGE